MLSKKNKVFSFSANLLLIMLFSFGFSCGSRQVSDQGKSNDTSVSKQNISRQIIVRFKKMISESFTSEFAKKYNAKVIKSAGELNSVVLEFNSDKKLEEITKSLNSDPDVDYAETNSKISVK